MRTIETSNGRKIPVMGCPDCPACIQLGGEWYCGKASKTMGELPKSFPTWCPLPKPQLVSISL